MPQCLRTPAALCAAFIAFALWTPPSLTDRRAYEAAVEKGRARAEAEIGDGEVTVFGYSGGIKSFFELLDRETGLPKVGFADEITDELSGLIDGHNARIEEYTKAHGPPPHSFKRFEKELFGLREYFEARCDREKPLRLEPDGPVAMSPIAGYGINLVKKVRRNHEGRMVSPLYVSVSRPDRKERQFPLLMSDGELFWGPEGSGFAVIRGASREGGFKEYLAIDLWRGRVLRLEYGKK
jgi:hypothetical protein